MNRRDFLHGLAASGSWIASSAAAEASKITRVLVIFKCHLDVGFTNTQALVMSKYFNEYYPRALDVAAQLRQSGADRYTWTTGSWLLYEYLEQATAPQRKRMEDAVAAGDIAWHALPFSWQTEVLDRSMIAAGVGLSKALDKRFGKTTTGAKTTDVPGHTRGIVGPLAENGVKFLHIGVNSASTPPEVPSLFQWKDTDGSGLVVMYHHKDYGGTLEIPGSDLAVSIQVRNDNDGPHTPEEVHKIFADLRKRYPKAKISASTLTEAANAIDAYRTRLPVVTQEIGDTWIHGIASDPIKLAHFREMSRLRREWIEQGKLKVGDALDLSLLRRLLLGAEHTWGTDTKSYLDNDHYRPQDLAQVLNEPKYKIMTASWAEKRVDIDQSFALLPVGMGSEAFQRLGKMRATEPSLNGLTRQPADKEIETVHFLLAIDPASGAIRRLQAKKGGREWASQDRQLAAFSYQTFSKADFDHFLDAYVTSKADWAPRDFGKPNIEKFGAKSGNWSPNAVNVWSGKNADSDRITVILEIRDRASQQSGIVAWPRKMYLEAILPHAEPIVQLNFSWFQKPANRLPEALWLSFAPKVMDPNGLRLEKSGRLIDPLDVVRGGNRHMHAVTRDVRYSGPNDGFIIQTHDAPLVALGVKSPIQFSNDQPDLSKGLHFSLFNNGWGTNYPQWFGEDVRFRFTLRFSA